MTMPVPDEPKIYHIVHIDRLASIVADNRLWCDAKMVTKQPRGTTIGMNLIKERRRTNALRSHSGLCVGDCVPFYFCPRSVMLYLIYQAKPSRIGVSWRPRPDRPSGSRLATDCSLGRTKQTALGIYDLKCRLWIL